MRDQNGVDTAGLDENPIAGRIMELLTAAPGTKTSEFAMRLGLGALQVRNALMQLEARMEVHRSGQTRGTRWYMGEGSADEAGTGGPPGARRAQALEADGPHRGPKERVLDDNRDLLGKYTDAEVAERTGASIRTIAGYRKKHGISGYAGPRRRSGGTTEVVARTTGPIRGGAWRIEIRIASENLVRYAFAASLVDAARAASAGADSLGGEVVGIAFLGEALG